jgi:flagellar hook-associated protein 3 FlgL
MRITNSMLQRATLSQIQSNMQRIADAQQKVSTGRHLQKASDDPSAAGGAMRARTTLRALDQYKRGIDVANSRAEAEESTLDSVVNVLTRAKVVGVGQATDTADQRTRRAVKAEVDQLFEHLVQLANTRLGDDYIFGGTKSDVRPYTADATAPQGYTSTSPTGERQVEIAEGRYLKVGHNGVEAFENTGAFAALHSLSKALGDNDADGIRTALGEVDLAFTGVQTLIGDIGARTNHLQITRTSLDALEVNLQGVKSELEEVHIEEAITDLVGRQTTLQAAMLATSRVMGLSLANYLR